MSPRGAPHAAWAVTALFAAALAAYWGALRYPPVFDDGQLTEHFLRSYGTAWFRLDLRWFAYASFGWTYDMAGRDWFWLRLGNVLLHAAVAAMLFVFLRRLFAAVLGGGHAWWALFGALIFLIHPAAVYAVAYLVQRPIVMATLFGLVSLHLFLEGLLRGTRVWFLASAAAYFVAVFSKEHAVMIPAVAAVLAFLVRGASPAAARSLVLPFALYAAIGSLVVLKLQGLLGAHYEPFAEAAVRQLAESERAAAALGPPEPGAPGRYALSVINQGFLFFRYLLHWLLPYPGWMSIDIRPAFPVQLAAWPQTAGFLAWLAYPGLALALLLKRGHAGLAGLALLAPWLLALTEMAAVRVQEPFVLYRSYLWMCLLPAALPALLRTLSVRASLGVLCAASLVLIPPFIDRLRSFSGEFEVWDDAVRKNAGLGTPLADRAWRNRGVAHYKAGRHDAALADFERALELDPKSAEAWMTRGTLFMRTARTERALADFDRALALDARHVEALGRRCVVRMRLKRLDDALADCAKAAEIKPYDPFNFTSLGMVHALRGEPARAESMYRRALTLDAGHGDTHYQLGVMLRGLGRAQEARRHFAAGCRAGVPPACEAAR